MKEKLNENKKGKNEQKLSVALLLSDLETVHQLTMLFKKLNVVPHFYADLKSFWTGTLEKMPSLCIVDVKKMSEGELFLGDHPAVQAEELPLVFYYEPKNKALLVSTYQIYHLGTLGGGEDLEGQLKSLLKRQEKMWQLESECAQLRLKSFSEKSERDLLAKKLEEKIEVGHFQKMATELFLKLEKEMAHADFFGSLSRILQNVSEVAAFSYVELSLDGQKILSPLSDAPKYKALPFFRAQKVSREGIEELDQSISHQMAESLLKGPFVALYIKGAGRLPEKILYIKAISEEFFEAFDWNLFESYLNGFYARSELALRTVTKKDQVFTSPFSMMGHLDSALYGAIETIDGEKSVEINLKDAKLVEVDLSRLVEIILKRVHNRFYWQKFERDFVQKFKVSTRVKFEVFSAQVNRISFIIEGKKLDLFYEDLKSFSKRFSYFMYFENSNEVMLEMLEPVVSMTPMSSHAYLTKKLIAGESAALQKESLLRNQPSRAHEI